MTGLLNKQVKLLEYLTSGGAIFGGQGGPVAPELGGIDRGLLDLEARFSHEKRMEKIAGVFPATFELLGSTVDELVREFAKACPPYDISRIENARQFQRFLTERHRAKSFKPPYVVDVSACELACAEARVAADETADEAASAVDQSTGAPRPAIRRRRGLVLQRTAFDVRIIFEGCGTAPAECDTCLAVAWTSGEPRIVELTPEVFGVLAALERWTALDGLPQAEELAADLARAGLLELRR